MGDLETLGLCSCARAGEGVILEQLRHCLSVLISARHDSENVAGELQTVKILKCTKVSLQL